MSIKVTQLTDMNIRALREMLTEEESARVTLTVTTAKFDMAPADAVKLLGVLRDRAARHGRRGHPYQSLAAVKSKVERAQ